MPQLQINQGPQDALLYDNSRSYFTNVGYVRTSNFQMELRDVDSQNTANLGSTVQFVIPKAADLLGPCDLLVKFDEATLPDFPAATKSGSAAGAKATFEKSYAAWVENIGFAMIEHVTFSIGSHDVERITGEQMNIMNELMRTNEQRYGFKHIGKTGRGAVTVTGHTGVTPKYGSYDENRLIQYGGTVRDGMELIIPLGLFFMKHPSQYFPLAAIAGCNDVRIAIKFRTAAELIVLGHIDNICIASTKSIDYDATRTEDVGAADPPTPKVTLKEGETKLRCHYIHVTGPEATTLMNQEHVRLLRLWQNNNKPYSIVHYETPKKATLFTMDLSFLHPVQELIITIRKTSEIQSGMDSTKNLFAYQGSGRDPNVESLQNRSHLPVDEDYSTRLEVENFKLTLNGQERHPSLAQGGLDREYLMTRLMPMLHSNTSHMFCDAGRATGTGHPAGMDFKHFGEMVDRKEIYVYPFSLNPESANPSGAVNFSKVSHAKLTIEGKAFAGADLIGDNSVSNTVDYQVDVYGVHYNWVQIKDGRALTSFA